MRQMSVLIAAAVLATSAPTAGEAYARKGDAAAVLAEARAMQPSEAELATLGASRTPAEHQARYFARQAATAQHDSDRVGRWRSCPVRRCRRLGRCDSEDLQCERRPRR